MRTVTSMIFVLGTLAACHSTKDGESDTTTSDGSTSAATSVGSTGATTSPGSTGATSSLDSTSGSDPSGGPVTGTATTGAPATDSGNSGSSEPGGTDSVGTTTTTNGSTGAGSTTGGTMLIECNGCTCDPAVSYCQVAWSNTMDPPPEHPSGMCPFIQAGVYDYGCVLYPQACGDDPTCDCVPKTDPICGCMDAGDWLIVNCDYP
ncbi:MAG: hypothetical protein IPO88_00250 [Nannocystis sp.]|uniref:hypothetical protein n=1 Tax=Nannocystis sp. TaxID=1962667 RepID=UPI00242053FF|nr:hypothetical protein [Nannocystis sp.]MBK9751933.1 hypothetical protein [Nannocystis sp.]